MDKVKEAFQKVRSDIEFLHEEVLNLRIGIDELKQSLIKINKDIKELTEKPSVLRPDYCLPTRESIPTHNPQSQTIPTHNPTNTMPIKVLNDQNIGISTGNRGVPTDRQTNQQTNQQTHFPYKNEQNSIEKASELLDSLDSIKKEIRLKFKRLTDQEILVFSTLYQMEEEKLEVDYKSLSVRLNLSESSIRDYIGKLINKGIPVEKKKINNKSVQLFISPNLKKIASLTTILTLRGL
ncbi:MAG: hypothetical protein Q7R52_04835 [archaeon]|nr:hypothetical protein [archaeon]